MDRLDALHARGQAAVKPGGAVPLLSPRHSALLRLSVPRRAPSSHTTPLEWKRPTVSVMTATGDDVSMITPGKPSDMDMVGANGIRRGAVEERLDSLERQVRQQASQLQQQQQNHNREVVELHGGLSAVQSQWRAAMQETKEHAASLRGEVDVIRADNCQRIHEHHEYFSGLFSDMRTTFRAELTDAMAKLEVLSASSKKMSEDFALKIAAVSQDISLQANTWTNSCNRLDERLATSLLLHEERLNSSLATLREQLQEQENGMDAMEKRVIAQVNRSFVSEQERFDLLLYKEEQRATLAVQVAEDNIKEDLSALQEFVESRVQSSIERLSTDIVKVDERLQQEMRPKLAAAEEASMLVNSNLMTLQTRLTLEHEELRTSLKKSVVEVQSDMDRLESALRELESGSDINEMLMTAAAKTSG